MRVVSDTSPVSNLAIIGRLEFLRSRYGQVRIPPAVRHELAALTHPSGRACIDSAIAQGWLVIDSTATTTPSFPFPLDAGEIAAIKLALATAADVLLMDERRGRQVARQLGLVVGGVLGELLHAKFAGGLSALRPEFDRLRKEAGFFIDAEIESFILSQAGE